MYKHIASRISRRSNWKPTGGGRSVEMHSWRRCADRGKRRTTHGVYGTMVQINAMLEQEPGTMVMDRKSFRWTKFRNGKYMVW